MAHVSSLDELFDNLRTDKFLSHEFSPCRISDRVLQELQILYTVCVWYIVDNYCSTLRLHIPGVGGPHDKKFGPRESLFTHSDWFFTITVTSPSLLCVCQFWWVCDGRKSSNNRLSTSALFLFFRRACSRALRLLSRFALTQRSSACCAG